MQRWVNPTMQLRHSNGDVVAATVATATACGDVDVVLTNGGVSSCGILRH